ncbi:ATP-dependent DNA helicase, partial [Thraustotheca clavata]
MFEKRKELKKKKKLQEKALKTNLNKVQEDNASVCMKEKSTETIQERVQVNASVPENHLFKISDEKLISDIAKPSTKPIEITKPYEDKSTQIYKPVEKTIQSFQLLEKVKPIVSIKSSVKSIVPTKRKAKSFDINTSSEDEDFDTSEWKKQSIREKQIQVGSHAVSDNFVKLTMRKRVKGSRGNPKKKPLYMRPSLYDKAEVEQVFVSKATYDGVDVVQEVLTVLEKPSNSVPSFLPLEDVVPIPICYHGIPAQRLVVKKKTNNFGRAFFACTRKIDEGRCDFFLWEQNHPAAITHTLSAPETPLSPLPTFKSPLEALRVLFGHAEFKPGQQWAIDRLLHEKAKASLLILPTGAGKSLCYQLPSLFLPGLTLVISPLISLINDQMEKLPPELRERAASFSSANFKADQASICRALYAGQLKLLFVSPERAVTAGFHALLQKLTISLVCVDEAHCLSEWSHNFRPSFLRLGPLAAKAAQVLALTATASNAVTTDIARILSIPDNGIQRSRINRTNLELNVQLTTEASRLDDLRSLLSSSPYNKGSVIVYVHTQYSAGQVAGHLSAQAHIKTSAYHAGMETEAKEKVRKSFLS